MAQKIQRVRRTQTQVALYFVSVVMLFLAAVVIMLGAWVILSGHDPAALERLTDDDVRDATVNGLLVIVAGVVTLATGVLGIAAANDQRRVGPYRWLCYSVALLTLLVIIYGWSNGAFLLFNPLVLTVTIVYVLICSSLADRVQEESDLGVKGTVIYRDGHQRALHFLVSIIVAEGVMYLLAGASTYLFARSGMLDVSSYVETVPQEIAQLTGTPLAAALSFLISGVANLTVGLLGLYGSNHPTKITPFLVISILVSIVVVALFVLQTIAFGPLAPDTLSSVVSVVFSVSCTVLAFKVRKSAGKILD